MSKTSTLLKCTDSYVTLKGGIFLLPTYVKKEVNKEIDSDNWAIISIFKIP